MSLESMLYEFHGLRRDSYLSPESVRHSDLSTVPGPPGGSRPSDGVGDLWDGGIRTSRVPSMSVTVVVT